MKLEQVIVDAVRARSHVFTGLANAYDFNKEQLFAAHVEFFDALINAPLVDIDTTPERVKRNSMAITREDGTFVLPVESFIVHMSLGGSGQSHVFVHFKRVPLAGVIEALGVIKGATPIDVVVCKALTANYTSGKVEFSPRVPMALCSCRLDDGGLGFVPGLMYYEGSDVNDFISEDAATDITNLLTDVAELANNDQALLKVPAVRRTLQQVAKGKHRG